MEMISPNSLKGKPNKEATLKSGDQKSVGTTYPSTAINQDPVKVVSSNELNRNPDNNDISRGLGQHSIDTMNPSTAFSKDPVEVVPTISLNREPKKNVLLKLEDYLVAGSSGTFSVCLAISL